MKLNKLNRGVVECPLAHYIRTESLCLVWKGKKVMAFLTALAVSVICTLCPERWVPLGWWRRGAKCPGSGNFSHRV